MAVPVPARRRVVRTCAVALMITVLAGTAACTPRPDLLGSGGSSSDGGTRPGDGAAGPAAPDGGDPTPTPPGTTPTPTATPTPDPGSPEPEPGDGADVVEGDGDGADEGSGGGSGGEGADDPVDGGGPAPLDPDDAAPTGRTFYVDPVRGSADGTGAPDAPWATLAQVFDGGLVESRSWTSLPATRTGSLAVRNPGAPVRAGDTIVLASGDYGPLRIRGYYNDAPITIRAGRGQVPRFSHLGVTASKNWVLQGLTVQAYEDSGEKDLVNVSDHDHHGPVTAVVLTENRIETVPDASRWSAADWNAQMKNGIRVRADGVTVTRNTIRNVNFAIQVLGSHAVVDGNTIDFFAGDGLRSVDADSSRFTNNRISNSVKVNANHDDAFQNFPPYDGVGEERVTSDLVLSGNTVVNCEGVNPLCGPLQGLVSFDGAIERWEVEGNDVTTNHWHGITLNELSDSSVRHNVVRDPDQLAGVGPTWIAINPSKRGAPSVGVLVECNVASSVRSAAANVDVTLRRNTLSNAEGAAPPAGC